MTWENYIKFELSQSFTETATPTSLCMGCGCFHAPRAELSGCDRDCTGWSSQKNFVSPTLEWHWQSYPHFKHVTDVLMSLTHPNKPAQGLITAPVLWGGTGHDVKREANEKQWQKQQWDTIRIQRKGRGHFRKISQKEIWAWTSRMG